MSDIKQLEDLIIKANNDYYSGISKVSDEQYDAWKSALAELDPNNRLLVSVGAPVSDDSPWKKQKHLIPMSSLDKVNNAEQFKKWAIGKSSSGFSLQEKLDGLSLSIDILNGKAISATTRGDGLVGENILRNALLMNGIPKVIATTSGELFSGSIRGEVILKKSAWRAHFPELSNPRNGASGISRRLDGKGVEHLDFIAYDLISDNLLQSETVKLQKLTALGFAVPNFFFCKSADEVLLKREEYISSARDSLDYDIDGLVIKIDSIRDQEVLGRSGGNATGNPNGQIAFKFANEMRETVIRNVSWEVGLTGRITPVAEFDSIILGGASVTRASLYNFRNVQDLGVTIGCKALVSRRNDIIPSVEKVLDKTATIVVIPDLCPTCKCAITVNGEYLTCTNSECAAVIMGNIQKWIDNVGIDGVGPQLVESLYLAGLVKRIPDLYLLKESDLSSLDRLGDKSASKIIKALNGKKQIPLNIFLGSLNIPNCGRRVFESLIEQGYDSLELIQSLLPAHFEQVDGIGPKMAQEIYHGLKARKQLVADLLAVGIKIGNFLEEVASSDTTVKKHMAEVSGKSFCFTGAMSQPRGVLESYAKKAGGTIRGGVSSGLDFLVMADPSSNSTKAVKARSLGTKTISENEFLKLVGK